MKNIKKKLILLSFVVSCNQKTSLYLRDINGIDTELATYYKNHGIENYQNKLIEFAEENGLDDDNLLDEFGGEYSDCLFTDFDDNFPLPSNKDIDDKYKNEENRELTIFSIVKNIYQEKDPFEGMYKKREIKAPQNDKNIEEKQKEPKNLVEYLQIHAKSIGCANKYNYTVVVQNEHFVSNGNLGHIEVNFNALNTDTKNGLENIVYHIFDSVNFPKYLSRATQEDLVILSNILEKLSKRSVVLSLNTEMQASFNKVKNRVEQLVKNKVPSKLIQYFESKNHTFPRFVNSWSWYHLLRNFLLQLENKKLKEYSEKIEKEYYNNNNIHVCTILRKINKKLNKESFPYDKEDIQNIVHILHNHNKNDNFIKKVIIYYNETSFEVNSDDIVNKKFNLCEDKIEYNDKNINYSSITKIETYLSEDNCCSICQEDNPQDLFVQFPNENCYKHIYHKDCLKSWFKVQNSKKTCPLCRKEWVNKPGLKEFITSLAWL